MNSRKAAILLNHILSNEELYKELTGKDLTGVADSVSILKDQLDANTITAAEAVAVAKALCKVTTKYICPVVEKL